MIIVNEPPLAEKTKTNSLRFPVDPIHSGLRLAVLGSFAGAGIITFIGGISLIPDAMFISVLLSGITAAGASVGVERFLRNRWSSGREFLADDERIALAKHGKIEAVVDAQEQVNVLAWRFEVKRDSPRAKKGWHVLGLAFEQGDDYVVIYSTASPEEFETMPLAGAFTILENKKNKNRINLSSSGGLRRAGEQKRLYNAEVVRQMIGGDMIFENFVSTIEFLQRNYPHWMISD